MEFQNEWFAHPEWWFNCASDVDEYIASKYEFLLELDNISHLPALSKIIIFDQLPHHIYRGQSANHIIAYFLQKAITISESIIFSLDFYDDHEFCFILLPLRHSKIPSLVYKSINMGWERINKNDSVVLRRFLTASYNRCPLVGATLELGDCTNFSVKYSDILYHLPLNKPVDVTNNPFGLPSRGKQRIIISLSGGVDSMVCSWMITQRYSTHDICAVHINYNNRPSSDQEACMVADWCDYLEIPCYVRKLHEIRREPCMKHGLRNIYETYTKNVRYKSYKELGGELVVLGHNYDDVIENIFTNIAHKNKYENLGGMTAFSEHDDILFWRPLLGVRKDEIIEFANNHNIPYLPNSTPVWSQRGQIRNSIIPVLDEWDTNFVSGICQLSERMKELHCDLHIQVKSILSRKEVSSCGAIMIPLDTLSNSYLMWKILFGELGFCISDKSLKSFIHKIKSNEKIKVQSKITLSKECKIIVFHQTNVIKINSS